jgi:hypothetical protein
MSSVQQVDAKVFSSDPCGETEEIVCATLSLERLQWARKQLRLDENLSIKVEELTRRGSDM